MPNEIVRTGKLQSRDATLTHYVSLLVREFADGSVEYLVGDSATRRDGWATLPDSLAARVEWD